MQNIDKKKINNRFFDLIFYVISFILSIIRSVWILLWIKKSSQKWMFFRSLDYIMKIWPKDFWKSPNWYKLWNSLWGFIKHTFYNKDNKTKKYEKDQ